MNWADRLKEILIQDQTCRSSYDDHSINVVQETKVEEYEMYGCPKPVSLDEALRRPRGGGRTERVAVVQETEVDEVLDSDAIRWDERQNPGHTTQHLFDCAENPTDLTVDALWKQPVEASTFLRLEDDTEI